MQFLSPADIGEVKTEAIGYQKKSPFARELISLFQEIIDYREEHHGEPQKAESVLTLGNRMINERLPPLILKHTGIRIVSITYSRRPTSNICISPILDNDLATVVAMNRSSGNPSNSLFVRWRKAASKTYVPLTVAQYEQIRDSLDLTTGKIDRDKLFVKDSRPLPVNAKLRLDLFVMLLAKDRLHEKCDYLTAEQLTAIILHEIGHVIATVEVCAEQHARCEQLREITEAVLNQDDPDTQIKMAKTLIQADTGKGNAGAAKSADALNELIRAEQVPSTLTSIRTVVNFLVGFVLLTIVSPFWVLRKVIGDIDSFAWKGQQNGKLSDVPPVMANAMHIMEYWADGYAAQHGLGAELSEALNVMGTYAATGYLGTAKTVSIWRTSKLAWYACHGMLVLHHVVYGKSWRECAHPDAIERLRGMRRVLINNLTVANVDDELKNLILDDLDRLEKVVGRIKPTRQLIGTLRDLNDFFNRHLTVGAMLAVVTTGKLTTEYDRLHRNVMDLVSNNLFAAAERLELRRK